MRAVITPTFSAAKLRAVTPIINECAKQLVKHLNDSAGGVIDLKT